MKNLALEEEKYETGNPLKRVLVSRFVRAFSDLVSSTNPRSILDVGCGAGYLLRELVAVGRKAGQGAARFYGCDVDSELIEEAKKRVPDAVLSVQDIFALDYEPGSFDLVLCSEVLEHLAQPEEAVEKICRITREWIIFSVPNEPWFRLASFLSGKNILGLGDNFNHMNHWSAASFANMLKRHCTVKKTVRVFPWTIALCRTGR